MPFRYIDICLKTMEMIWICAWTYLCIFCYAYGIVFLIQGIKISKFGAYRIKVSDFSQLHLCITLPVAQFLVWGGLLRPVVCEPLRASLMWVSLSDYQMSLFIAILVHICKKTLLCVWLPVWSSFCLVFSRIPVLFSVTFRFR